MNVGDRILIALVLASIVSTAVGIAVNSLTPALVVAVASFAWFLFILFQEKP